MLLFVSEKIHMTGEIDREKKKRPINECVEAMIRLDWIG